jgi:hypothetical protein
VYRDPGPEGYRTSLRCVRGEEIAVAAFPEVTFRVDELLG